MDPAASARGHGPAVELRFAEARRCGLARCSFKLRSSVKSATPSHHPDDQQRHESAARVRAEHRAGGPSARLEVLHVETGSAERCIDDGDAKAVMRA